MNVFSRRRLARLAVGAGAAGLAMACSPSSPPPPPTAPLVPPAPPTPAAPTPTTPLPPPTPTIVAAAVTPTRPVPVPIRAGSVFVDVVDSPLYIGFSRGYYARVGIDLQLQQYGSLGEMLEPLGAGQLEVVFDAVPSIDLFAALTSGGRLKLVANQGTAQSAREAPFTALAVARPLRTTGQVQRVADLKGKTVGIVARATQAQLDVEDALRADGLAPTDARLVELSMAESLSELRAGGLAAAYLTEPYLTQGMLEGDIDVLANLEKLAPARDFAEVIYSQAFAQRQPLANNFMLAYLQGVRDYLKLFFGGANLPDRSAVVDQLIGYLAVKDSRLFGQMALPWIHPDGRISAADLHTQRAWFAAQGQVGSAADLTAAIDPRYVDYALGQLGPYAPA